MRRSSSLPSPGVMAGVPAAGAAHLVPGRAPPAGQGRASPRRDAARPAAVTAPPSEDQDELAQRMNDIVIRRIFAAGLDLQGALCLVGEQHGASQIRHAIDELDQAIRDIRDILFGRG